MSFLTEGVLRAVGLYNDWKQNRPSVKKDILHPEYGHSVTIARENTPPVSITERRMQPLATLPLTLKQYTIQSQI